MPINNPTLDALFPRGIRNYNPGNIQNGPFAQSQPGYVGSDGRFAQFDTMDNGLAAHSALLDSYGNKGLNTLNAIINRWAPSSDGNRPANYAAFVGKKLGIDPNQPLDMSDPNVRKNIATAMGTFENGMSPTDPRSWQASGSPQPATGAPMQLPGAVAPNTQQQGAQSISLGDEENQQPFNNIGSTLANMGASIASLDNRGTGIASLNASRVASNLTAQEAAREKEGGWKYAGQTQNGQGLMFQNSKGEIRVEPLTGQFAGERENKTTSQKDYEFAKQNGYTGSFEDFHNGIGQSDPESLKLAGMDWLSNGNPQALKDVPIKQRPEAMRLAREQFKKDTGQDFDPADLALRRGDYKTLQAESSKFGQMLAPTQAAHDRLQEDIKIAKERVADLPSELNSSNMPFNKFMQMTAEQLQQNGYADKLVKARESIYNVERGYSSVQANGLRSGDTVAAQKRAEGLINSAMTADTLLGQSDKDGKRAGGLLDFMGESSTRILNSVKGGQETLRKEWKTRARNFGSGVQQNEDNIISDIDKQIKPPSISNTPASSSPTISREDALAEARRRGLIK